MALQNIRRRALRNALTVTGLAIFVLVFIMVSSLTATLQRSLADSITDLGGEIMVWDENALVPFFSSIPENYIEMTENISFVKKVVPQVTGVSRIETEDLKLTVGVAPSSVPLLYTYTMVEGSMISSNESSAAVGSLFAEFLGKHVGDNITVNGYRLPIVGIYRTETWMDNAVIVPYEMAQSIFTLEGRASIITIILSDPSKSDYVISEVRKRVPSNVGVYESQEATGRLTPLIDSITWISLTLFTIAGVACFLGIMNVVMTSLFERTREIGILKAIGARGIDVMRLILFESAALGVLGGLIGCFVSLMLLYQGLPLFITSTTSFDIPILAEVFFQGLAFSVAISVLATLYPVWRAVRVRPHEVLRFG